MSFKSSPCKIADWTNYGRLTCVSLITMSLSFRVGIVWVDCCNRWEKCNQKSYMCEEGSDRWSNVCSNGLFWCILEVTGKWLSAKFKCFVSVQMHSVILYEAHKSYKNVVNTKKMHHVLLGECHKNCQETCSKKWTLKKKKKIHLKRQNF